MGGASRQLPGSDENPDLLAALRRQWATILIASIIGTLVGWAYATSQPTRYESRSTLLLIAAGDEQSPGGGRDRTLDVDTWATVARSTVLLQQVANQLGRELGDVRARTTATAAPTGDVLVFTFEAGDSDVAVEGATVYSEQFLTARRTSVNAVTVERQQQLEDLQQDLTTQIADLSALIATEEQKGDRASESQLAVLTATQQLAIERSAEISSELATIDTNVEAGRIIIDPSTAVNRAGLSRQLSAMGGLFVGVMVGLILALLRDRFDDRYGSATSVGAFGLNEIARIPFAPEGTRAARVAMHEYSRLITRLTFANRGEPEAGRSVLLLPVDTETLPPEVARSVAATLETGAKATGILIGVLPEQENPEISQAYWDATVSAVHGLRDVNDLALVPMLALDRSATGIGLAALVDDTLLLVSEATPMQSVVQAINDLRAVDVDNVQVVVVTGVPSGAYRRKRS